MTGSYFKYKDTLISILRLSNFLKFANKLSFVPCGLKCVCSPIRNSHSRVRCLVALKPSGPGLDPINPNCVARQHPEQMM